MKIMIKIFKKIILNYNSKMLKIVWKINIQKVFYNKKI